jgi:hypothetical protein
MGGRWKLLLALVLVAGGLAAAGFVFLFDRDEAPARIVLPQPIPEASYDLASALEELDGTPGARFSLAMAVVDPALGRKPVRLEGRGVFNCAGEVSMTVNYLSVLRRALPGTSLEQLGLVERDLVGEIVSVGSDFYMRLPALPKLYPGAKPWIHAESSDEDASAFELVTRDDPDCADFLPYLQYGLPEPGADDTLITELAEETVRGRQTTHYVLSVSPAEIAAQFDVTAEDLERALALLGGRTFDIEFWIDGDGLIRRVSYHDVWPGDEGDPPTEGQFTLEFFDYGVAFEAKRPPKPKVMEERAFDRLVAQAG